MSTKIIVPTDFSEHAFIAAQFACKIAIKQTYHIHLIHFHNSKTTIFDEKMNAKEPDNDVLNGELLIKEWKDSLKREFPNVHIHSECINGLITDTLPKIANKEDYAMIVMGSKGLAKKDSALFGSITSQVASKSKIPVLAIPNSSLIKDQDKAAILTNFKEDELESLKEYITLLGSIPTLDIIHVYQNSDNLSEVEEKIADWSNKIKLIIPETTINTVLKPINYNDNKQDTIAEVVNNTINEYHYNMVIVTKTRKSFFDRLFSRSISKEVILELETVVFFDNN